MKAEEKEYTSTSTMPLLVNFDSLLLGKVFWGRDSIWVITLNTDHAGCGDSHMFIETINGKPFPDFWPWDGNIVNNSVSTIPLFII